MVAFSAELVSSKTTLPLLLVILAVPALLLPVKRTRPVLTMLALPAVLESLNCTVSVLVILVLPAELLSLKFTLPLLVMVATPEIAKEKSDRVRTKLDSDLKARAAKEIAEFIAQNSSAEQWDGLKANLYAAGAIEHRARTHELYRLGNLVPRMCKALRSLVRSGVSVFGWDTIKEAEHYTRAAIRSA
jgi:hypothetical protein